MKSIIENWAKDFPRKTTPNYSKRHEFQIKHCGNEEIRVKDGSKEIWADGIDFETGELLEAKFIENPAKSPYLSNSEIPPFIRAKILGEVENEFRRYTAVINDPNTPVTALKIIVNIEEAKPFFESLLLKFNLSGRVVIMS
jgi:hypothetical protein